MNDQNERPIPYNVKHLAWHETLEIHELVALQSIALMEFKHQVHKIHDPALKALYMECIHNLSENLRDLLQFYPMAPHPRGYDMERNLDAGFYSGHLLGFAKTAVRSYAIAITETATPALKSVLNNHLQKAIKAHTKVYNYMYQHGYYPSYNLNQLLQHDKQIAHKALQM